MSSLKKKSTLSYQIIAIPPTRYRKFKFCYSVSGKTFLTVFMCYVLSVYEKMVIFFISVCFAFFNGFYQFYTSNYRAVLNFLQFSAARSTNFRQFVEKFDNLFTAFRRSYDIESTVYCSSRLLKLKPDSSPYTHNYPNAPFCLTQEVFSPRFF